ncbi:MAG: hypothetical protein ACIAQF_06995 [Phycisphaerales bacterium JB065]
MSAWPAPDGVGLRPWHPADGTMAEVAALIEKQYGRKQENSWFAHPTRLTVEGKDIPE